MPAQRRAALHAGRWRLGQVRPAAGAVCVDAVGLYGDLNPVRYGRQGRVVHQGGTRRLRPLSRPPTAIPALQDDDGLPQFRSETARQVTCVKSKKEIKGRLL
ncbi:hypothetical protein MRX96_024306 [Rhipicephalus microplus]